MTGENIWHSCHILRRRSAFYDKIEEYYKDGMYSDVNIICEKRVFKCHRLVLAAVSEYFHFMFCGNFAESNARDVVLHDVDSVTFEQILLFVYRGEIATIDDNNVFDLLRASDFLQLSDLEDHCVHYLTQKNIPMDIALEIYSFASALGKVALIPALSRFILQHLDRFSQESRFLSMSFKDFSSLLTYFQPLSASRDTKLLKAILKWVRRSTDTHENWKSSFMELAQEVQFKSLSVEQVVEYFDQNLVDSNDESRRSEVSETLDTNPIMEMKELSLHVYIKTAVREIYSDEDDYEDDSDDNDDYWIDYAMEIQTSIFSLEKSVGKIIPMNWHHSHTVSPAIEEMRIVKSPDGRLYYLKFHNQRFSFSSSTAFDLCTNEQSLALPSTLISVNPYATIESFRKTKGPFSLCYLREKIYLNGLHNVDFQCYNTELDTWSPIPILNGYEWKNLVNDDARLYMIDKKCWCSATDGLPLFAAYDPRAGKVEKLNDVGLSGSFYQPGCYHKSRIYMTNDLTSNATDGMAIYDPAAGQWDFQDFVSSPSYVAKNENCYRLVSLNNRLCMVGLYDGSTYIFTDMYDSYLQEWNGVCIDKLCDSSTDLKLNCMSFTDVFAC